MLPFLSGGEYIVFVWCTTSAFPGCWGPLHPFLVKLSAEHYAVPSWRLARRSTRPTAIGCGHRRTMLCMYGFSSSATGIVPGVLRWMAASVIPRLEVFGGAVPSALSASPCSSFLPSRCHPSPQMVVHVIQGCCSRCSGDPCSFRGTSEDGCCEDWGVTRNRPFPLRNKISPVFFGGNLFAVPAPKRTTPKILALNRWPGAPLDNCLRREVSS